MNLVLPSYWNSAQLLLWYQTLNPKPGSSPTNRSYLSCFAREMLQNLAASQSYLYGFAKRMKSDPHPQIGPTYICYYAKWYKYTATYIALHAKTCPLTHVMLKKMEPGSMLGVWLRSQGKTAALARVVGGGLGRAERSQLCAAWPSLAQLGTSYRPRAGWLAG